MTHIVYLLSRVLFIHMILSVTLFANLQNNIEKKCPQEYMQNKDVVSKYLIRMEDSIYNQGCTVIPIYAAIIESKNFDILDEIEDNPHVLMHLKRLSLVNKKLFRILFQNNILKEIILSNSINEKFMKNFIYLIEKKFHSRDFKKIRKNYDYLNYYLLSALYAENHEESLRLYKRVKASISIELMPSFTFVLSSLDTRYDFYDLLENFATLERELSTEMVKQLAQYPEYFVYFLYPEKEDLGISTISNSKLRKYQKDIQRKVIFIYKKLFDKYNNNAQNISLVTIEYLYPYLLEQYDVKYEDYVKLFSKLIEKDYIYSLLSNGLCSKTSEKNFEVFSRGNIRNIIALFKQEKPFAQNLLNKLKDVPHSTSAIFYTANFYKNYDKKEWIIFKDLLATLPYQYDNKIAFLQKIEENGYFNYISARNDYKVIIIDAQTDERVPKYKYILTTPYPSKESATLFMQVLTNNINNTLLSNSLLVLSEYDKESLEMHNFEQSEQIESMMDTADNILTIASIALAVPTGGISLGYVAIKTSAKVAGKAGFKYIAKKAALKSRKIINKAISQARKIKSSTNNTVGSKNLQKIDNTVNKIDNSNMTLSTVLNGYLYFNNSNLEAKSLCQE